MGDAAGYVGVDVDGVGTTADAIGKKAPNANTHAKGLQRTLDDASNGIGHPVVKGALAGFVTSSVTDTANKLGHNVQASGRHVKNVSTTTYNVDVEGGAEVGRQAGATEGHGRDIRTTINPV